MNLDTIKASLGSLQDKFLRYWFIFSALALAILYFLYDRRGRQLSKAIADAQEALLMQKLSQISEKAQSSQEDYEKAKKDYDDLKRRHSDLFDRLRKPSKIQP